MITSIPYKAIYVLNDKVLLYRGGNFYISNGNSIEFLVKAPLSFVKKIASKINLTSRLLRIEPRAIERLSDALFVIAFDYKIWILDLLKKEMRVGYVNRSGWSNPLNFCTDGHNVYWGEYGNNNDYDAVKIYSLGMDLSVREVYSFPKGSIRHIHNICYDIDKQSFWIFTGDNEPNAGIYMASQDWKIVAPIKIGSQKYRTVVGFPYNNGLIYATDSVSSVNHIFILSSDGVLKDLATINGSSIYGTETHDYYVFSTTVEPPEGRGFTHMFTNNLGDGILSREVHLIFVRKKDLTMRILTKFHKDCLPMKWFQYGVITFPKGQDTSYSLWLYPVACKEVRGKSLYIDRIYY